VKRTTYFEDMCRRPDRAEIKREWIQRAVAALLREFVQDDGRVRRWVAVPEAKGRILRVVLLSDGETVHNTFFDRSFKP